MTLVLLWGIMDDDPMAAVYRQLIQMGIPVVFIDQLEAANTEIDLFVGSYVKGSLRISKQTIDLSTVTAVYLRPYPSRINPKGQNTNQSNNIQWNRLNAEDAILCWSDLTPALVINRPSSMASNNSKPYQLVQIRSHGFEIPDTILTTDPNAVQEFWIKHGTVVYKSISGIRSIVSRLTTDHIQRLQEVSWCPTQFQQYITGDDYRVHIVGDKVFACQIISNADDYRYAIQQGCSLQIRPIVLPDDIHSQCKSLVAAMKLLVAGLDLKRTRDGKWYCFEVNPSPAFTYYQEASGQEIDKAIALLLNKGE